MVYLIEKSQAIRILHSLDPVLYKDLISMLSFRWVEPSVRESLRILACNEGDSPSLAIIHKAPRLNNITSWDVHLVIRRKEDITCLLDALPKGDKMYMFLTDPDAIRLIEQRFALRPDVTQIQLHAGDMAKLRIPPSADEVIALSEEHEPFVRANESPYVQHYWDVCAADWANFRCFGLIRDGRVVSFCAVGPDTTGACSLPIREIIWLYTENAYRRQGLAKAVLSRATTFIIKEGATAYYSLESDNIASLNTAKSVGYVEHTRVYAYWAESL